MKSVECKSPAFRSISSTQRARQGHVARPGMRIVDLRLSPASCPAYPPYKASAVNWNWKRIPDARRPWALSRRFWLAASLAVGSQGMKKISYKGYRFPPEIIQQAIWLYLRFTLSFRDVEDLLAERGITVSYETIRRRGLAKTRHFFSGAFRAYCTTLGLPRLGRGWPSFQSECTELSGPRLRRRGAKSSARRDRRGRCGIRPELVVRGRRPKRAASAVLRGTPTLSLRPLVAIF